MLFSSVTSKLRARLARLLAPIFVALPLAGLALASCQVPQFDFKEPAATGSAGEGSEVPVVPHCRNGELDADLGESDFDCGRGCSPCGAGNHCTDVADCDTDLICHDGTCLGAGCMNDVIDGAETDVDCGGGSCKTCINGQSCGVGSDCDSGVCKDGKCQKPACDDGVANGNETSKDCGGDCTACLENEPCRVSGDCVSGECNDRVCGTECMDGFANCDKQNDNGCEISLRTDSANCGTCGNACKLAHASSECSAGECRIATDGCDPGYLDCNGDPADGCEVNLKTDAKNCGACDKICPDLNGTPSCVAGMCQIDCNDGFEDCDHTRDNGCEVNLNTNSKNCNECGTACPAQPGNSAYCKDGACGETTCPAGLGDCNGDPSDPGGACETSLDSDVENCGACGNKCEAVNANVACVAGKCVIASCKGNFADCVGGYADGCETNPDTSTAHCGGCNKACSIANGSPKCEDGVCGVKSCSGTFRDCDGDPKTGCEVNIATSDGNCGGCGTDCNSKYAHASASCASSACGGPVCDPGYDDCSGGVADGCETNVAKDQANCGACGRTCQTSGVHVSSNACVGGQCDAKCSGSYLTCDNDTANGCEADSTSDRNNCGACGSVCSQASGAHVTSNPCVGSGCNPQCSGTYRDCDSNGNNGCEVDTAVTRNHCGSCTNVCDDSAAANVVSNNCSGSSCKPVCNGLYDDCDNKPQNGCEKSVAADIANCGACNQSCGVQNAKSTSCASGSCAPVCNTGWGACATPEQGCVTPLGTNSNCTKCGESCSGAAPYCAAVGCTDHKDIVVVNSGETAPTVNNGSHATAGWTSAPASGAAITLMHALQTPRLTGGIANNRLILAGVTATDNYTNPSNVTVTYGGVSMTPVIELVESKKQSYSGIFYLLDASLPAGTGTNSVVARVGASGTWGHAGVNVLELKNAMQQVPFVKTSVAGGDCSTGTTRAGTLTFSQPGSLVYAVLGARGGHTAALSPATGLVESWNERQSTPDNLMSAAAYIIADDSRTVTWTVSSCYNSSIAMVAVKRLSAN